MKVNEPVIPSAHTLLHLATRLHIIVFKNDSKQHNKRFVHLANPTIVLSAPLVFRSMRVKKALSLRKYLQVCRPSKGHLRYEFDQCHIQYVSIFRTFSSLERSSLVELSRDKDEGDVGIIGDNIPLIQKEDIDVTDSGFPCKDTQPTKDFPQMSVTVVLQGFSIGASLLPSLKVEYKVSIIDLSTCFVITLSFLISF